MQFAVGDMVVHPHHGPGRITGIEYKELSDGPRNYYVIEIPNQGLTVHVPGHSIDQIGMRRAMRQGTLLRVLGTLQEKPGLLPLDYKERQERIWEQLKTGRPLMVARVIRDLTWHQRTEHLTKKDSELLKRGVEMLASEIALVTGSDLSAAQQRIQAALNSGLVSSEEIKHRQLQAVQIA
jgi:CarD family transcriptional regulator